MHPLTKALYDLLKEEADDKVATYVIESLQPLVTACDQGRLPLGAIHDIEQGGLVNALGRILSRRVHLLPVSYGSFLQNHPLPKDASNTSFANRLRADQFISKDHPISAAIDAVSAAVARMLANDPVYTYVFGLREDESENLSGIITFNVRMLIEALIDSTVNHGPESQEAMDMRTLAMQYPSGPILECHPIQLGQWYILVA